MHTYEGMFLFDPATSSDFAEVEAEIKRLLDRANATLIVAKKWGDRRIAYEIKGRRRGLYVLVFFRAEGDRIVGLQRDVELSDRVLRVLFLRADHMTEEQMQSVEAAPPESDRDRDRPFRSRPRRFEGKSGPREGEPEAAPEGETKRSEDGGGGGEAEKVAAGEDASGGDG